ncbi:LOW QUALITY PROTEIN: acetylserotonin O-methyltransferase-like [Salvia miltiorrhiza]|uniref:LOW QUALITY PROTEIN: acetylserotonin O-methyltransferase-like n=1 Tax=Salvia miltiorrhiza TaxID=226208 RepID=UPI0025AC07F9|nr:LOW QUALITY PROTEIN: acetylserotonin O-methyltransferase-like [Salvia miltiorrhiza]
MAESKGTITADAKLEMWRYALGFTPTAVVRCTIELQIADVMDSHGGTMTHGDLSAAVGYSPTILRRIMRYLVHQRFFKQTVTSSKVSYAQTPLSRLLMRNGDESMAAFILLESSPTALAPWNRLSSRARESGGSTFEEEHGSDIWSYTDVNPAHSKLFDDAMSCVAKVSAAAIVNQYPKALEGIESLVDVGGGDGTALRILLKAFPRIHGINFDRPSVVSVAAPPSQGIQHVAGSMFEAVPNADAAFLMSVLHDWNDEECIQILKKCKEAIKEKVIIVEAVIREEEEDKYSEARLRLDMLMLAYTTGKERTFEEWKNIIKSAGFTSFAVKHIEAIPSIIEAYP